MEYELGKRLDEIKEQNDEILMILHSILEVRSEKETEGETDNEEESEEETEEENKKEPNKQIIRNR